MGTWRYVVSCSRGDRPGEFLWEIRELHLSDDGSFGYTENAIGPSGDSFDELIGDLVHMRADADLEILDLTSDPPRLVPMSELQQHLPAPAADH